MSELVAIGLVLLASVCLSLSGLAVVRRTVLLTDIEGALAGCVPGLSAPAPGGCLLALVALGPVRAVQEEISVDQVERCKLSYLTIADDSDYGSAG